MPVSNTIGIVVVAVGLRHGIVPKEACHEKGDRDHDHDLGLERRGKRQCDPGGDRAVVPDEPPSQRHARNHDHAWLAVVQDLHDGPQRERDEKQGELGEPVVGRRDVPRPDERGQRAQGPDEVRGRLGHEGERHEEPGEQRRADVRGGRVDAVIGRREHQGELPQRREVVDLRPPVLEARLGGDVIDPDVLVDGEGRKAEHPAAQAVERAPGRRGRG